MKRSVTKYVGVYGRKSDSTLHKNKPDVCLDISYKAEGKKIREKVGWESEGYTARLASQIRSERLRDIRFGNELPRQKKKAPLFTDLAKKYLAWAAVIIG